jgi:rhodanese-related sulfurtransferase
MEPEESMSEEPEETMSMEPEASMSEEPEESMSATYMDISVEDAKKLIDETPDLVIIDVSPDYDAGHLPGAVHYYLGDGSLEEAIPTLDKSKPYLVYCHADAPSIQGATMLADAGFMPVYRLQGNYAAWVDAGYPVEQ